MPRGIRLLLLEPGIDTAAQGDDVGEAALAKGIDGLCGTHAAGAVDNGRSIWFDVGALTREYAVELKVRGVGDGGLGTLGGGADVDKRGVWGNLADLGGVGRLGGLRAGGLEGNVFPGTGKGIEVAERAQSAIPNSTHFELDRILGGENPDIEPDAPAIIYCASGMRSAQAVDVLRQRGFTNVVSLRGGINSWLEQP